MRALAEEARLFGFWASLGLDGIESLRCGRKVARLREEVWDAAIRTCLLLGAFADRVSVKSAIDRVRVGGALRHHPTIDGIRARIA